MAEECHAISWNDTSSSCSLHHWLLGGISPASFVSTSLMAATTTDHVVLVRPIPVLHTDTGYTFTFTDGEEFCRSINARVTNYAELSAAFDMGYFKCKCAWVSDGIARLAMTFIHPACGNYTGINPCY